MTTPSTSAGVFDFTLYDVVERNASAYGERVALIDSAGTEVTFRELRQRVDRVAHGLEQAGIGAGDRVCFLALNSISFFELLLACARQGCIAYPINWRWTAEEVARVLQRARPRAFAVDGASLGALPESGDSDEIGRVELWIALDDGAAEARPDARTVADLAADPPASWERPQVGSDDAFVVIATAAVDVIPRGALLSHRNLVCADVQEIAALQLDHRDANLVALPLFHIAGLGHALTFFHAGATNVITPRFDAAEAVALIDRHHISHISDFPPVLSQVLDAAQESGSQLASLRYVSGLDSPETMQRLHEQTDAEFISGFGQTETSGFVTLQRCRERLGCAGKPAEMAAVRLVDDYDREVPTGTAGEIVVRGPLVFLGYDGQADVTDYTFRNGWHHTGDVGRFDDEGNLFYVKRKAEKELIKPGGENVYPAEVETVIVELPGVDACCVFGVPDEKWGEAIKAVVEVSGDAAPDAEGIVEHVGGRIARFKRPRHVELVEQLPRTDDGEVDREAVKARHGGS